MRLSVTSIIATNLLYLLRIYSRSGLSKCCVANYLDRLSSANTITREPWKRHSGLAMDTFDVSVLRNGVTLAGLHVLSPDVIVTISQWSRRVCGLRTVRGLARFRAFCGFIQETWCHWYRHKIQYFVFVYVRDIVACQILRRTAPRSKFVPGLLLLSALLILCRLKILLDIYLKPFRYSSYR